MHYLIISLIDLPKLIQNDKGGYIVDGNLSILLLLIGSIFITIGIFSIIFCLMEDRRFRLNAIETLGIVVERRIEKQKPSHDYLPSPTERYYVIIKFSDGDKKVTAKCEVEELNDTKDLNRMRVEIAYLKSRILGRYTVSLLDSSYNPKSNKMVGIIFFIFAFPPLVMGISTYFSF